ncbi:MAG: 1-acyl-sn-glycerol-3-phosphate acyltransferase [Flavobacteriales bacterium]|jgi:1-acyl-sn-glycerol-3-phosphate acyltransferase|nr:1-acyl-sn-glycerol-3-phosphate acyltransferase [Flavobacteriales bacterium]
MNRFFYAVWKYWVIVVGVIFGILFLPLIAIILLPKTDQSRNFANIFIRHLARALLLCVGIITVVKNKSRKKSKSKQFVYIANHRSYLDIIVAFMIISPKTRFIAKQEIFSWPVIGYFMGRLGHIPVDRSSPTARKRSLENIHKLVRSGSSLMIFPEGGIHNYDKILHPFKKGGFSVAVETETAIWPFAIHNAHKINPSAKGFAIKPGYLKVCVLEEISAQGKEVRALMQESFDCLHKELKAKND